MQNRVLNFSIKDPLELNLSYIPFILGGGMFIPTKEQFILGETIQVNLLLEKTDEKMTINGKVVWITPLNALHHVLPGIGIQFMDDNKTICAKIEGLLTKSMDVGGYTCGITETVSKNTKMV